MADDIATVWGGQIRLGRSPASGETLIGGGNGAFILTPTVAFSAYSNVNQAIGAGVYTKVMLGVEGFDTNNNFASSTFTPTIAGYYQLNGGVSITGGNAITISIYKNGGQFKVGNYPASGFFVCVSTLVYANGTDSFDLYAYSSGAATIVGTLQGVYFNGALVSRA